MPEEEVEVTEESADSQASESSYNSVRISGQDFEVGEDGNVNIPANFVADDSGKPYFNQFQEATKKVDSTKTQYEQRIQDMERQYSTILSQNTTPAPQHDPDDYVDGTNLTYKDLGAIERRQSEALTSELKNLRNEIYNNQAEVNLNQQKFALRQDAKFKTFFQNKSFETELDERLKYLSLESALQPDIVKGAAKMVIGDHFDEFVKEATDKARRSALENRTIVGEVQLGESTVKSGGKQIRVTPEIEQFARDSDLPLEMAAEVIEERNARLAKMKK